MTVAFLQKMHPTPKDKMGIYLHSPVAASCHLPPQTGKLLERRSSCLSWLPFGAGTVLCAWQKYMKYLLQEWMHNEWVLEKEVQRPGCATVTTSPAGRNELGLEAKAHYQMSPLGDNGNLSSYSPKYPTCDNYTKYKLHTEKEEWPEGKANRDNI